MGGASLSNGHALKRAVHYIFHLPFDLGAPTHCGLGRSLKQVADIKGEAQSSDNYPFPGRMKGREGSEQPWQDRLASLRWSGKLAAIAQHAINVCYKETL